MKRDCSALKRKHATCFNVFQPGTGCRPVFQVGGGNTHAKHAVFCRKASFHAGFSAVGTPEHGEHGLVGGSSIRRSGESRWFGAGDGGVELVPPGRHPRRRRCRTAFCVRVEGCRSLTSSVHRQSCGGRRLAARHRCATSVPKAAAPSRTRLSGTLFTAYRKSLDSGMEINRISAGGDV